jgi:hypothetical protein
MEQSGLDKNPPAQDRLVWQDDDNADTGAMVSKLLSLQQRLTELEIENVYLRDAAMAFGDLADRLNRQLREERRLSRGGSRSEDGR